MEERAKDSEHNDDGSRPGFAFSGESRRGFTWALLLKALRTRQMEHCASKQVTGIAYRMLMISSILAICAFVSGCKDSAIIWFAESQSPDKHYIASARTEQYGGLGTPAVITTVYLKQRGHSPVEILSLSNESAYPLGITAVNMAWITPSHLSISYRGHADISFQAIKCAGVEISVEKKGE